MSLLYSAWPGRNFLCGGCQHIYGADRIPGVSELSSNASLSGRLHIYMCVEGDIGRDGWEALDALETQESYVLPGSTDGWS